MTATAQERAARAWAEVQEPQHVPLWQAMMDASAVGQDMALFDAGCGCGGVSGLAAARGARVTAGPVVAAVWSEPETCEFADYFHTVGKLSPPAFGAKTPFELSGKDVLADLFARAGTTVQDQGEVHLAFEYADASAFWNNVRWSGGTQRAIDIHGKAHVKAELSCIADKYRQPDGRIRFRNRFRFAMGTTRPA